MAGRSLPRHTGGRCAAFVKVRTLPLNGGRGPEAGPMTELFTVWTTTGHRVKRVSHIGAGRCGRQTAQGKK